MSGGVACARFWGIFGPADVNSGDVEEETARRRHLDRGCRGFSGFRVKGSGLVRLVADGCTVHGQRAQHRRCL